MAVSDRLAPFGVTIFTEMTQLALEHDAINLGQGFPNWDGANFVKEAAARSMADGGHDQYPPSAGVPALRAALAEHYGPKIGRDLDPDTEVTVTSGCTEGLAAAMLGLINPGDEVVVIEPFYDAYPADVALAGGVIRPVTLEPPEFALDSEAIRSVVTPRTRVIILNNPHNPTGRVFGDEELAGVAELCQEFDLVAISDEVYEEMVYDRAHLRLASFQGMWDRTLTLSSLGKTFSLTGWKLGWAIGPAKLTSALRAAHQFLTFTTPTPVQHGGLAALGAGSDFYDSMRDSYRRKRDLLAVGLSEVGFEIYPSEGTYFMMASHPSVVDDREFCRRMAADLGVVAIPPSVFYADPDRGQGMVRFAFCKDEETLRTAVQRLEALA